LSLPVVTWRLDDRYTSRSTNLASVGDSTSHLVATQLLEHASSASSAAFSETKPYRYQSGCEAATSSDWSMT
jgi:hypothetical protein